MTAAENYKKWSDNAASGQDQLAKWQADYDALLISINSAKDQRHRSFFLGQAQSLKVMMDEGRKKLEARNHWLEQNRPASPAGSSAEGEGPSPGKDQ